MTSPPLRLVAFLRAVNVGRRRVRMEHLRELVEAAGCTDVTTVGASGNVLLTPPAGRAGDGTGYEVLEADLERTFAEALGFEVETVLRDGAALERPLSAVSALERREGDSVHVVFLRRPPTAEAVRTIEGWSTATERLSVTGPDVLWHLDGGVSSSALTARHWARAGHPEATARNVTVVTEIAGRLGGRPA